VPCGITAGPKRKLAYTSLFPYFGGKSKLSHLYSEPVYNLIIEPFAGAAAYSLRYHDREIWLNDVNPRTVAALRLLTSGDRGLRLARERIPYDVAPGPLPDGVVFDDDLEEFKALVCANMAQGAGGTPGGQRNLPTVNGQASNATRGQWRGLAKPSTATSRCAASQRSC